MNDEELTDLIEFNRRTEKLFQLNVIQRKELEQLNGQGLMT
jgi:hypothetical protein